MNDNTGTTKYLIENDSQVWGFVEIANLNPKDPGPIEPWLSRADSDSKLVAPW